MPANNIQSEGVQEDNNQIAQPPSINQQIKRVSPMTFSQKLYQSRALEIAEEYEQAINENSLEKIRILLNKVLELD